MTIPARAVSIQASRRSDTPLFNTPPTSDDGLRSILTRALATDGLSPKAHRLLTAAALAPLEWYSSDDMAALAGISGHTARPLLAELVRAGLLVRTPRSIQTRRGHRAVRNLYSVAVTA